MEMELVLFIVLLFAAVLQFRCIFVFKFLVGSNFGQFTLIRFKKKKQISCYSELHIGVNFIIFVLFLLRPINCFEWQIIDFARSVLWRTNGSCDWRYASTSSHAGPRVCQLVNVHFSQLVVVCRTTSCLPNLQWMHQAEFWPRLLLFCLM